MGYEVATMEIGPRMPRIGKRDIEDLSAASVALAEAAATIQATKSAYVPAVIALLRQANETILRIRDRGLAAVVRLNAKRDDQLDKEAREKSSAEAAGGESDPAAPAKAQEP